ILEAQLGQYVDGLRGDSLAVGLWSGELELRDLALKPQALAALQLPVTIVSGSVARVLVRVPWNQLGSASVCVSLEGVSALVVPNTQRPSAAELQQAKRNQLERRELLRQHRRFAARVAPEQDPQAAKTTEQEDEGTFVSRLTARIVANLQVTLCDVHLRYEDAVANPEAPFACGFLLERFRFHTTDADGNEAFVDQTTTHSAFTHKKAELTQLGVYWDRLEPSDPTARLETHQDVPQAMRAMVQTMSQESGGRRWLLRPCSLGVQVTKNESADYSTTAKYAVQAHVGALQGSLSREQYEDVLFLQRAFLGRQAVEAHFTLARGRPLHSPGARPREWWDYATRLVLEQRRAKLQREAGSAKNKDEADTRQRRRPHHRRMRWSSIHTALLEQQLYVEAFRMQVRNGGPLEASTRHAKFKRRYEEIYPLDVILLLRDAAEDAEERAKKEQAKAVAKASSEAQTQATQSSTGSWYSYFFGGDASPAAAPAVEEEEHVLTAEGRENLREAYEDAVEKASSAHEVPVGCNLVAVQLELADGSLALYQSNGHADPFVTATLVGSLTVNVQPENEWDASFRLQHFAILNGRAVGSRFHTFCTPSGSGADPDLPCASVDLSRRSIVPGRSQGDEEMEATLKIRIRTQPVRVMVDPSFLLFLHAFFLSLLPEKQLEKVWQFATSSVADWMFSDDSADEMKLLEASNEAIARQGKEDEEVELMRSLERAQGRVAYDVAVDMDAPVLILPENVAEPTGDVVVVDLGLLSFRNDEEVTAIDTAIALSLGALGEGPRRLNWRLEMTNIHVLLGRQEELTHWTDEELRGFAKIVEDLTLEFSVATQATASRLKLPSRGGAKNGSDKPLPQVGVRAVVPRIAVSLAEAQLVALGRIHSSVLAQAAAIAQAKDKRLGFFENLEREGGDESATESESSGVEAPASASVIPGEEKFLLDVQLSLGCVELNLRESKAKDAFLIRASQTSFAVAMFSSHQEFRARLKALVMEDKLYKPSSRFYELISTGDSGGDAPHLIAIDVTAFPPQPTTLEAQQRRDDQTSQLEADVHFNVLHLQWNPSSVALLYRIVSAYATVFQYHDDDLEFEDAVSALPSSESPAQTQLALDAPVQVPASIAEDQAGSLIHSSGDSERRPLVVVRASLVHFSVTFNKDQLDRQLVRLEMTNAAINFTSYDVDGGAATATEPFEVTGHVGNFVGTDLSTEKHPLYTPLVGLDERESRQNEAEGGEPEALLTFGFVCDPVKSDKSSLRLAFRPIRVVYYHQQILELVDFLLEGVLGALVGQTLMNATQLLLREDEASVVLDLTIEKPALVLPLSLQDAPHAKVTADVLRLVHFPSSAVHYEGAEGARTKRVVHDESLPRAMVHHSAAEGGGASIRVDCKDIFLEQVHIYCTTTSTTRTGETAHGDDRAPCYQEMLSKPADLTISVEDLVSSSICLGEEEVPGGSGETRPVFLPRITVDSVLPPLEVQLSRTNYLAIVALILENFGADELENAPGGIPTSISRGNSASRLGGGSIADLLPSLRPTVTYTYLQPDAEDATLFVRFVVENVRILLLQDGPAAGPADEHTSPDALAKRTLASTGTLADRAFAEVVATDLSIVFTHEFEKNPNLVVCLGAFSGRDLAGEYSPSLDNSNNGTLLVSPQPLEVHYSWDEVALTGELDLLFAEVTGTVIPDAVLSLLDFFTLPSKPARAEGGNGAKSESETGVTNALAQTHTTSPAPSLLMRRQSISDILRDGKEPELALTVRVAATQVGVAVPRDAYDPRSPRLAFTGDFALEFKWKPHPDVKESKDSGDDAAAPDLDIQSSILADARNMEVVLENASRPGCCVASSDSNGKWDAIEVAPLIQLLEPCDLHVEVSDLFPHAGQRQQIVALAFTPIDVFVSYDDACVALDTMQALNDATALYESRRRFLGSRQSPHAGRASNSSGDGGDVHVLSRSRGASKSTVEDYRGDGEEIHRYFTCEFPSVSLTLINDCDGCDMGLAQLQMERCHVFLNVTYTPLPEEEEGAVSESFASSVSSSPIAATTTTLSGGGGFVVLISYYNPDTRDWHPMCAQWALDASVQGAISGENELHVILTATQPLDLTVTHGLLEVMASVGGAWKRRTAAIAAREQGEVDAEESVQRKGAPCVIRNETGLPLSFWLTNGTFTTAPETVSTGGLADLRYLHAPGRGRGVVRRYASADRHAANLRLCLQLMDAGGSGAGSPRFQAVQGLIFEQLGARTFPLMDARGQRTNFSLSLSAQLVEGRILLVVSSPIKLVNRLASGRPVALLVNDPTWHSPVEIGVLQPHQESAVPVLLSLASELRVRPVGNGATYSWSAPIPVQTRSVVELKVEAAVASTSASRDDWASACDGRNAVYCVAMAAEQELRVVSFAEPLVLVNKLPVPVTYRVRTSYNSAYGSSTASGGNDSPLRAETIAVGAKSSIWWTDSAQRPLFQLTVEGCTSPSKWLELAPRGTSSGAVLAVQLSRVDDGRPFQL
ncbi:hypothetical protein BBJ28_00020759, partial [Nothophytophthora sp. Chile5]